MGSKVLSDENIAFILKNYRAKDPEFGAKALAKQFGVTQYRVAQIVRGRWQAEKHSNCIRCGIPLTKWQRKYCSKCSHDVWREDNLIRLRKKAAEDAKAGIKRSHRKSETKSCDHMEWEADICLNCTRPSCNNCLQLMSLEEREELLENCGGKNG